MDRTAWAVLAMALIAWTAPGAEAASGDIEYYTKFAEKRLAEAEAEAKPRSARPPVARAVPVIYYEDAEEAANVVVAVPEYHHSREDGGSSANGPGATLRYTRRISDSVSLSFIYRFSAMDVSGDMAVPAGAAIRATEDMRWLSHTVGVTPEIRLSDFGNLYLPLSQSFDRAHGSVRTGNNTRDVDGYGADVTSFAAWWKKDFAPGGDGAWTISPFAGWRSLYRNVRNDDNRAPAASGIAYDDSGWQHFVSGGLELSFRSGPFAMNLRGGVSHRVSGDDSPGFGDRAVAPGVSPVSHRAYRDRTVGGVGAGVRYDINGRASVGVGYEGMFGRETGAHTGSVSFMVPF